MSITYRYSRTVAHRTCTPGTCMTVVCDINFVDRLNMVPGRRCRPPTSEHCCSVTRNQHRYKYSKQPTGVFSPGVTKVHVVNKNMFAVNKSVFNRDWFMRNFTREILQSEFARFHRQLQKTLTILYIVLFNRDGILQTFRRYTLRFILSRIPESCFFFLFFGPLK